MFQLAGNLPAEIHPAENFVSWDNKSASSEQLSQLASYSLLCNHHLTNRSEVDNNIFRQVKLLADNKDHIGLNGLRRS